MAEWRIGKAMIKLEQGDITEMKVDAIVNAANEYLKHGGGVAAAIVRKGGVVIQEESNKWIQSHGVVPTGSVAVTTAGKLPVKYVIHAVGPVWRGGQYGEEELLRNAILNSLKKADELQLESIAFPAISTGIFGYPVSEAARVLLIAARDYLLRSSESTVKMVYFVLYDKKTFETFSQILEQLKSS